MHVLAVHDGNLQVAVDTCDHRAIDNSLAWIAHGLNPIADDELLARTGMSKEASRKLLDHVHSVGSHSRSAEEDEAVGKRLWFSMWEMRSVDRMFEGILDGWIDIQGFDWELIGVDEHQFRRTHEEIRNVIATARSWKRPNADARIRDLVEQDQRDH